MTTASHLNTAQSITVQRDHAMLCGQASCKKWSVGGVGTTLAVCTLVFIILSCIQPHGFISSVGTIGNPHAWPLWTMAGGGLIVSTLLIAYATCSKEKVHQPGAARPFHKATNFSELLGEECFNQLSEYPGVVPNDGKVDQQLMTKPIMKGEIVDRDCKDPCIIFALRCRSNQKKLEERFEDCEKDDAERAIGRVPKETMVLILIRHGHDDDVWAQWSTWTLQGYRSIASPSFLRGMERGGGRACIQAEGDQKALEEQGWGRLKQLIEGDDRVTVTGYDRLEWGLEDRLVKKKEEGATGTNPSESVD